MMTCKNILCCTDFSEGARAALSIAVDIAKKYGATLHLVHVYQDPEHLSEFGVSSQIKMDWIRLAESLGAETEKRLQALCSEITQQLKSCHSRMLRGRPPSEIIRYAKENDIDLIVLGSHGLSGWEQVLFGSTAEGVLRQSPCSVLVIKKPGRN